MPLPLSEDAAYQTRRNKLNYDYNASSAANQYGRFVGQQRFDRSRQDLMHQFAQQRQGFDNQYLKRGLFNSGIRNQGLVDYNMNRLNQTNALEQDRAATLGQFDIQANNGANAYQQSLVDIERERQARIADLAAQLSSLNGGY